MTLRQFLAILRARHRYIWLVAAFCTLSTLAFNLWRTKQYTATATVLIDLRAPDPLQGPGQMQAPAAMIPGYMATQVDIISSERVAQDVVRQIGLDKNEQAIRRWKLDAGGRGTIEQFYADFLKTDLDVKPSRESNLIDIRFTSPDPEFAASVANAFAKDYIATNVALKVDPARDYATFFDARTKQLREQLEQAQTRLSQYQRETGIIGADERLDVETARLNELNTQLTTIQGQRTESGSRERAATDKMATSPDVVHNPVIETLSGDVARTEAKLDELGQNVGHNHPQYLRQQAELQTLKAKLDSEMTRVANSLGAAHAVDVRREVEVRAALDEQKRRVLELRTQRDEVSVLQREVETAQHAYDLVAQRLSQSSLESQSQQTNVLLLSPAQAPTRPSHPKTVLNTAIALLVGLILGAGTTLLVELIRPRLRGVEDVTHTLGLPVLVTLPAGGKPRGRSRFGARRKLEVAHA
jgi:chain length determinant protein EpsF